jgi:hypothetical protein
LATLKFRFSCEENSPHDRGGLFRLKRTAVERERLLDEVPFFIRQKLGFSTEGTTFKRESCSDEPYVRLYEVQSLKSATEVKEVVRLVAQEHLLEFKELVDRTMSSSPVNSGIVDDQSRAEPVEQSPPHSDDTIRRH